jgi:hypothetical protein
MAVALLLQGLLGAVHPFNHIGNTGASSWHLALNQDASGDQTANTANNGRHGAPYPNSGGEFGCRICLVLHAAGAFIPAPEQDSVTQFLANTILADVVTAAPAANSRRSPAQPRAPPPAV